MIHINSVKNRNNTIISINGEKGADKIQYLFMINTLLWLTHVDAWQKSTQLCKAFISQ